MSLKEAQEAFKKRRDERRSREYAELREKSPEVFCKCVETASAIALNHFPFDEDGKRTALAADIEAALVSQALGLLSLPY